MKRVVLQTPVVKQCLDQPLHPHFSCFSVTVGPSAWSFWWLPSGIRFKLLFSLKVLNITYWPESVEEEDLAVLRNYHQHSTCTSGLLLPPVPSWNWSFEALVTWLPSVHVTEHLGICPQCTCVLTVKPCSATIIFPSYFLCLNAKSVIYTFA